MASFSHSAASTEHWCTALPWSFTFQGSQARNKNAVGTSDGWWQKTSLGREWDEMMWEPWRVLSREGMDPTWMFTSTPVCTTSFS